VWLARVGLATVTRSSTLPSMASLPAFLMDVYTPI
jgi:hypothetical protein